jgi:hypothetical protein
MRTATVERHTLAFPRAQATDPRPDHTPPNGHPGRYRAPDSIIAFLDNL